VRCRRVGGRLFRIPRETCAREGRDLSADVGGGAKVVVSAAAVGAAAFSVKAGPVARFAAGGAAVSSTGLFSTGGSNNITYSRRSRFSQPASSVMRIAGSLTAGPLITTRLREDATCFSAMRAERTSGMPPRASVVVGLHECILPTMSHPIAPQPEQQYAAAHRGRTAP
jgi:hypothetical protein